MVNLSCGVKCISVSRTVQQCDGDGRRLVNIVIGALVKSVNNNITVTKRVKARTADWHLKWILLQFLLVNIMSL